MRESCAIAVIVAVGLLGQSAGAIPHDAPVLHEAKGADLIGLTGNCSRTGTSLAWSDGNLLAFLQGSVAELGRFRMCVDPPEDGLYCTGSLAFWCEGTELVQNRSFPIPRFSRCGASSALIPELAMCVPSTCSVDDLSRQLRLDSQRGGAWWGNIMQDVFGFTSKIPGACVPGGYAEIAVELACHVDRSYAYIQVDECTRTGNPLREREAWKNDSGRHTMVAIMFAITALCVLATTIRLSQLLLGFAKRVFREARSDESSQCYIATVSQQDDVSLTSAPAQRHAATTDEPLLSGKGRNAVNGSASVEVPHGDGRAPRSEPRLQDGADDKPPRKPWPTRVLGGMFTVLSFFDVIGNVQNLFTVTARHSAAVDTRWMEGVRVISMAFVVYGHTLFFPQSNIGFSNAMSGYEFLTTYAAIGVFPAELAVDAFFFMSGYLVYYLYHNAVEKQHKKDVATWRKTQEAEAAAGVVVGRPEASFTSSPKMDRADTDALNAASSATFDSGMPTKRPLGVVPTLLMYVHRWLRIAPVMMLVLFFLVYIGPMIPSGPLYKTATTLSTEDCITSGAWWRYLLFASDVDNPRYQVCAPWFWYLTCDFQMFLVAPVVCALRFIDLRPFVPIADDAGWLWRGAVTHAGRIAFYFTVMAFTVSGVALATHYTPFGSIWYFSATARWSPYVYGVLFAALIREPWIRVRLDNFLVRFVLLAVGTVLAVGCINAMWKMNADSERAGISPYVGNHERITPPSRAYVRGVNFVAEGLWGPALGCFSLAWGAGHGGWLVGILGHPVMAVLSKLTFCNYMIHPALIVIFFASQDNLPVFSQLNLYGYYVLFLPLTFIVSAIMHVTVELPAARLNSLIAKLYK